MMARDRAIWNQAGVQPRCETGKDDPMALSQHVVDVKVAPIAILPALAEPSLVDEANHRIANNLQMLAALISLEARQIADPGALAAFHTMSRRIGAIAGVHRQLYHNNVTATVNLGEYLADLACDLNDTVADLAGERGVCVEPASVEVSPEEAASIGMIVSELVGNAFKYAYEPDAPGRVRVMLRALPLGGYWLEVSDRGAGLMSARNARGTGLGTQLIAMMARRLGAVHAWHDNAPGTRFTLCTGQG
jgi:two-component sensor histidine kinase